MNKPVLMFDNDAQLKFLSASLKEAGVALTSIAKEIKRHLSKDPITEPVTRELMTALRRFMREQGTLFLLAQQDVEQSNVVSPEVN